MEFICYPKCSTCKRAMEFLDKNNIKYNIRNIKEEKLSEDELKRIIKLSGKETSKFFNTSGILYREKNLSTLTKTMSDSEKIKLLSTDGMLVKRPILVNKDFALVGFKESEYKDKLNV